jgi:hypothetical protein
MNLSTVSPSPHCLKSGNTNNSLTYLLGKERHLCSVDLKQLNSRAKQVNSEVPLTPLTSQTIEKIKNCHLFAMGQVTIWSYSLNSLLVVMYLQIDMKIGWLIGWLSCLLYVTGFYVTGFTYVLFHHIEIFSQVFINHLSIHNGHVTPLKN